MNVVDSSGWLEYFADGPQASFFASAIEETEQLIVPAITLYEVFKKVMIDKGEAAALQAVSLMHQGRVIMVDSPLALLAAKLSMAHSLPMADSLILATARRMEALLWTMDSDFEGLADVRFQAKGNS